MHSNLTELKQWLHKNGQNYRLLQPLEPGHAWFEFVGKFDATETVWQCHLYTLEHYASLHDGENFVAGQSFMEIEFSQQNGLMNIEIGLPLAEIDHSAIEKAIIMVTQYKRLKTGRHCWGT